MRPVVTGLVPGRYHHLFDLLGVNSKLTWFRIMWRLIFAEKGLDFEKKKLTRIQLSYTSDSLKATVVTYQK